jgi:Mn2+/Fe2+ NRAMP family transporter
MNDPDAHAHDLYTLPPEAIREPPPSLLKAVRQIGPGLILAASIVGTGELINTTSLGAKAGFSLLWLILLSCVIKVFVQVELNRYAITHGKTTLAAFDSLPGPRLGASWLCWLWLIMTLATLAQAAAMEGTVGQAAHMAFLGASQAVADAGGRLVRSWGPYLSSHEEHFWAAVATLAVILLLLSGGYRRLETITTVLVAAVTLFTVTSVLILQWTSFRIT